MFQHMFKLHLSNECHSKWITKVKSILDNNGFSGIWFNVNMCSNKSFLPVIHQTIKDVNFQNWQSEMSNNKRCVNYNIIKVNEKFERYLSKLKYWDRVNLCRFRCGDTKIPTAVES